MSSATRPHIFVLSHCVPYPATSGGTVRTLNVLKELQRDFDVSLFSFARRAQQESADTRASSRRALAEILTHAATPRAVPSDYSPLRLLSNHARSGLTRRPYTYYQYMHKQLWHDLQEAAVRYGPAIVHLDTIDLFNWSHALSGVPVTCTHHDIESLLLRRRAEREASRPVRWYLRHQAALIERIERTMCPVFDLNLMVSDVDADKLARLAPGSKTAVVPNGVDTTYFSPVAGGRGIPGRIIFVGPTVSFPNRDAVDYLLREIWPTIRGEYESASLQLAGRASATDAQDYQRYGGVQGVGELVDVRAAVQSASCSVVPIRVGGGTRLKILESWAMGVPVVSTSVGCEGLDATDGENILIRDDPEGFATAVLAVLRDPELGRRLALHGRQTVENRYSWTSIGRDLRRQYWNVIETGRRQVS